MDCLKDIDKIAISKRSTYYDIKDNNNESYINQNIIANNNTSNLSNKICNNNTATMSKRDKIFFIIKKLIIISNLENNIINIFGLDKIVVPFLIIFKKWISYKIPILNNLFFREKISSLTINYTHFTSTYYNQQNISNEYMVYRSILNYVYNNNNRIKNGKFSTNLNGNLMFFEQFEEIRINKRIWLISKVTTNTTAIIYELELISYNSPVNKINEFIKKCVNEYKNNIQKNYLIKSDIKYYKYIGLHNNNLHAIYDEFIFHPTKTFSNIFFDDKEKLVKQIKYFMNNEKAYKKLGIPYCMGILLHGKPGTGKTSAIKAVAALTKRYILDISLSRIKSKKELREIFYSIKINGIDIDFHKRLYVLEELDCILDNIKDRKNKDYKKYNIDYNQDANIHIHENLNIHQQNNPSFINNHNNKHVNNQNIDKEIFEGVCLEDLLCILDGIVEQHGTIFIATTNYIDLIDKALKRPGRFDFILNLDYACTKIIIQIIEHFAYKNYDRPQKLNKSKKDKSDTSDNSDSDNSDSNNSTMYKNIIKLSKEQISKIEKYSTYNDSKIWSPAKICQICLHNIDDKNYFETVIKYLEDNYEEEYNVL